MSCMAGQSGEEKARFMASSSSGLGYCYNTTDHASSSNGNQNTHLMNQFHNFHEPNQEIYNLSSSMDLIGFPPAWNNNTQQQHQSVTFPCDVNEIRPIQKGLSLSLSTTSNPPTIGVNSFQLTQNDELRFGTSSSRDVGDETNRVSRYLGPAQELLNEFCNLGVDENGKNPKLKAKMKTSEWQDGNIDPVKNQSLYSLDLVELHKRKTKLLILLEEVDKRYKHYCNQMKSVVQSFEAVAGNGAAKVYSALASRAMSRHFRCLKDGIVNQIKSTKKAMEEKDTNTPPGSTKGETPRLRLLDQTLRQQRAFQQMGMIENHPWRPQRGLPERSVSVLRAWLFEHFLHPYPSDVDKHILSRQTGLSRRQVSNWFINARVRLWKPMVEEMYVEEFKEEGNPVTDDLVENTDMQNQNLPGNEDQKPTQHQLTRIDSECLSSIINNSEKHDVGKNGKGFVGEQSYGAMELDFSSYGHQTRDRNVSLTLGLQQHGEGGVNLGLFPTTTSQNVLYYPRDEQNNMEDWQTVQYSLLDDQSQAFRNFDGC